MVLLLLVVVILLGLFGWWVAEVRRAWRRPVPAPQVRRAPPRPAQMRRRTDARVADEAEQIIRAELSRCMGEGIVPASILDDD